VILLVEGDGRLGPSEPRRDSEGVDGVHLLLGDVMLPAGFVRLGAPEDHEVANSLWKLGVVLRGGVYRLIGLGGRLWALPCWPRVPRM
jgi:hypothetical protein